MRLVRGVHASVSEWRKVIRAFLRERTVLAVGRETGMARERAGKMLHALREAMASDVPKPFSGVCEADETFIGGKWVNKPRKMRKRKMKPGAGTLKAPVVGVISRRTGQAAVRVLSIRNEETVIGFMVSRLKKGAVLYTDGYKMNRAVRKHGVRHYYVNHHLGEFARHAIHTNRIEGLWGHIKPRLAMIGGVRRDRLHLFVGEIVWRFNHRGEDRKTKGRALLKLILGR